MKRILILSVALVVIAAGCGSSNSGGLYTRAKAEACLATQDGVKLDHTLDFVASTATGGAFRAKYTDGTSEIVTVAFGASLADADNIAQAYRRFHAKNVGIDDILRQDRNAVELFKIHPSDAQVAVIGSCLTD